MLKIGEFALLSKISINMLRHYDEIGLLKPAQTNNISGYRYYNEKQLVVANQIQALKQMGLSLTMIRQILNQFDEPESLKLSLRSQLLQKQEDLQVLQRQITLLDNVINDLKNTTIPMGCKIAIKEIAKRNVISCRKKIIKYSQEGELWSKLKEETKDLNVQLAIPSYDISVTYGIDTENKIDVEVQQAVVGSYPNTAYTQFKIVPATLVATLTYEDSYAQLESINHELSQWILKNDFKLIGPIININHISPKTEQKKDKMLTEVCFPIKPREKKDKK